MKADSYKVPKHYKNRVKYMLKDNEERIAAKLITQLDACPHKGKEQ